MTILYLGNTSRTTFRAKDLIASLKKLAAERKTTIAFFYADKNRAVAIDTQNSMILYSSYVEGNIEPHIISTNSVQGCNVKINYKCAQSGNYVSNQQDHIDSIVLNLKFKRELGYHEIEFFKTSADNVSELTSLFQKARHWQKIILRTSGIITDRRADTIPFAES